jgi:hypothetical protein
MLGAGKIDKYWAEAFYYRVRTSVDGYQLMCVDDLVEKTMGLL